MIERETFAADPNQKGGDMRKWRIIAGCILIVALTSMVVSAATIHRTFRWDFQGRSWSVRFSVSVETYEFFRDLPRVPQTDDFYFYSVYVTDPRDDSYLENLTRSLRRLARGAGFDRWKTLNFVISFVQSLTYQLDGSRPYHHRARYPIETLVHRGGDCEDTSILAAALLRQMGYSVIFLYFRRWGEMYFPGWGMDEVAHMAIGVRVDIPRDWRWGWHWVVDGRRYFFLETIGVGFPIGRMPEDTPRPARIIELTEPSLSFTWESTPVRWDHHRVIYRVRVTVTNRGTGTSYGTVVYAGFCAGAGYVWDDAEYRPFILRPFSERTITLRLEVPRGEWTHLFVEVWSRNSLGVTERSGRFRP